MRPTPARGRVHQDGLAGRDHMGGANEVMRGQALENQRGRGLVRYPRGQLDEARSRHHGRLGITARLLCRVGDAVADGEPGRAPRPELFNHARRLHADDVGQLRQTVAPGAVMDVGEVKADRGMAHPRLARTRDTEVDRLVLQYFRTAVTVNPDRVDCAHVFPFVLARPSTTTPVQPSIMRINVV